MSALEAIQKAQETWALSDGISFDTDDYVPSIEANLLRKELSSRARAGYEAGAGKELETHMRALHSSSALVVNIFDYWTDRDCKVPLLRSLGSTFAGAASLDFEVKFPTGLRGTSPHLDVVITLSSGHIIAIESKFTEPFESAFSPRYFPDPDDLWEPRELSALRQYAEELNECPSFHPEQLLKHSLGLARKHGKDFSLYYLYYAWPGKQADAHEREISVFADRVKGKINFTALSYQQVFRSLSTSPQASDHADYLDYLRKRYFSRKGAPV